MSYRAGKSTHCLHLALFSRKMSTCHSNSLSRKKMKGQGKPKASPSVKFPALSPTQPPQRAKSLCLRPLPLSPDRCMLSFPELHLQLQ